MASSDDIKEEAEFLNKAVLFCTPAKRKCAETSGADVLMMDSKDEKFKRWLPSDPIELEAFIEGSGAKRGVITKAVSSVETRLGVMDEGIGELTSLTQDQFVALESEIEIIWGILKTVKTRIGNVVEVDGKFLAPTLWGSTSFIADEVVCMNNVVEIISNNIGPIRDSLATSKLCETE
jgi:hypothetical protein